MPRRTGCQWAQAYLTEAVQDRPEADAKYPAESLDHAAPDYYKTEAAESARKVMEISIDLGLQELTRAGVVAALARPAFCSHELPVAGAAGSVICYQWHGGGSNGCSDHHRHQRRRL